MMRKIRQKGVSLLEMMVSLTIGILLLLGLGSIYQVANQTSKTTQVLASNAEAARQVFNRLEYDFKRAGFVDLYDRPAAWFTGIAGSGIACPSDAFVNKGADITNAKRYSSILANKTTEDMGTIYLRWQPKAGSPIAAGGGTKKDSTKSVLKEVNKAFMTPVGYISCGTMRPVFGCKNGINGKPDVNVRAECDPAADARSESLQIAYQGANTQSGNNLSNLPNSALDCAYENIAGSAYNLNKTNGFIVNRYFLQKDTENNGELAFSCQGNAPHANSNDEGKVKALVPGIQDMAFRYVVTVPEHDSSRTLINSDSGSLVTAYKTAGEVDKHPLGWSGVVGVEVCLVVATKLPDGAFGVALNRDQHKKPICERDDNGELLKLDKEDNENDRFFERYIRTFSLPNSLYAPVN